MSDLKELMSRKTRIMYIEEYWVQIRNRPELKTARSFKCTGEYLNCRLPRPALRLKASTSGRTASRRKAGEGRRGEVPKSDLGP